jgi:hypothetical protein
LRNLRDAAGMKARSTTSRRGARSAAALHRRFGRSLAHALLEGRPAFRRSADAQNGNPSGGAMSGPLDSHTSGAARRGRWRPLLSILFASAMSNLSCVTVGKPFDPRRATNLREGESREDVVRTMGEPSAGNKLSLVDDRAGCVKRYRYAFADGTGAYVLWVDFDQEDRICRTIFTSG